LKVEGGRMKVEGEERLKREERLKVEGEEEKKNGKT
jgi:hypothetical protein